MAVDVYKAQSCCIEWLSMSIKPRRFDIASIGRAEQNRMGMKIHKAVCTHFQRYLSYVKCYRQKRHRYYYHGRQKSGHDHPRHTALDISNQSSTEMP